MAIVETYCLWVKKGRFAVFGFWLVIVLLGAKFAPLFTGATTAQYTSSHDADSNVAQQKMAQAFPQTKHGVSVSVLLQWQQGGASTIHSAADFLAAIKPLELELYHRIEDK